MEIKQYAPVVIPTLNRYEHFKRCLESLEKCTGANNTDIFIALDYPPTEKYVDGWKQIDSYLLGKEKTNGFRNLYVVRREHNYGIGHKNSNANLLLNDIKNNYECYIFTEDDNEFSPCFLEYMNQNLERYKDDPSIFRVCGYLPFKYNFTDEYSQFKAQRYIAWGVGCWRHKDGDYLSYTNSENILRLVKSKNVQNYFEKRKEESILFSLLKMSKGGQLLGDVIVDSYICYKGLRCILPTKSMVRNHGWDGSGQHGGYVFGYKEQDIQSCSQYLLNEAPASFTTQFEDNLILFSKKKKRDPNGWFAYFSWYIFKYIKVYCEFKYLHDFGKYIKNKLYVNK